MNRSIEGGPSARCYAPQCSPNEEEEVVTLLPEEIAVLELIDLRGPNRNRQQRCWGFLARLSGGIFTKHTAKSPMLLSMANL